MRERTKTVVSTIRCDDRSVAELLAFWESKGVSMNSLGQLVRTSLEAFAELIVEQNPQFNVQTHAEAVKILTEKGLIDLTNKRANPKGLGALLTELSLENVPKPSQLQVVKPGITPEQVAAKLREQLEFDPDDDTEFSIAELLSNTPEIVEDDNESSGEG